MSDVARWAAFSCVLVPAVLLWYGGSLADAARTALGLAVAAGVCVVLLRRSERGAEPLADELRCVPRQRARRCAPQRHGRHGRTAPGGAVSTGDAGGAGHGRGAGPRVTSWGKNGTGVHRGGRHAGGNKPVD
ncbi:hypothetical protein CW362_33340 [Streptomyces populi]|uniref:Uncharacterized protein n=1 Tax=Streptomyces populi TaxID=2058924 RepID=A0A2I0SFU8_9ACTN|nr:hypothetical protein [Streptomyces populi]PKT68759.1 hypothetical protein CW362_33340 [Streptomyces populi]